MYSSDERDAILGLWRESGQPAHRFARESGLASAESIRRWASGSLGVGWHAPYTLAQRADAARRALAGEDPAEVAASIGCHPETVRGWARAAGREGEVSLANGRGAPRVPPPADPGDLEALRAENRALRLELARAEAVLDVLKGGGPGRGPDSLTAAERALVADALRPGFGLEDALRAAGVARSTYYYHRARRGAPDRLAALRARVRALFEAGGGAWGYRTIWARLRLDPDEPLAVSEKVVRRVMREEGLEVRYLRRRRRWSSYAGEVSEAPPNLPLRPDGTHDFSASRPNELWVTDVTMFTIGSGRCWLSPVVDCFDGAVVAWTLSESPDARMADSMLEEAASTLAPGERPVVHTDRGCHYRWPGWAAICERHGLVRSMSRKGRSPDNAAAEGFFGRLKQEFYHGRDWSGVGFEEFRRRLAGYLAYYNSGRIKRSLGWRSPEQYRRDLGYSLRSV